jgi:hypothetical protein
LREIVGGNVLTIVKEEEKRASESDSTKCTYATMECRVRCQKALGTGVIRNGLSYTCTARLKAERKWTGWNSTASGGGK